MDDLGNCKRCKRPLIEIDHYRKRLVGCIDCNLWSWPGSNQLFMELPEEDIEVLKERFRL
jgi:hypothetical protein